MRRPWPRHRRRGAQRPDAWRPWRDEYARGSPRCGRTGNGGDASVSEPDSDEGVRAESRDLHVGGGGPESHELSPDVWRHRGHAASGVESTQGRAIDDVEYTGLRGARRHPVDLMRELSGRRHHDRRWVSGRPSVDATATRWTLDPVPGPGSIADKAVLAPESCAPWLDVGYSPVQLATPDSVAIAVIALAAAEVASVLAINVAEAVD